MAKGKSKISPALKSANKARAKKPAKVKDGARRIAAALAASVADAKAGKVIDISTGIGAEQTLTAAGVAFLKLSELKPSPFNPRDNYDAGELEEMALSLERHGQMSSLVVRRAWRDQGLYEIIAGERRYRAMKLLAGRGKWPADRGVLVKILSAEEAGAREMALVENLQRSDLSPVAEGRAFADLRKLAPETMTVKEIAKRISKSPSYVKQRLALVEKLTPAVQKALTEGEINFDQARILAGAPKAEQKDWVKRIAANEYGLHEPAKLRQAVRRDLVPVSRAIFDVEASKLETVEDVDKGERFFVSREKFVEAQLRAARAESNKTGAKLVKGYLDASAWRAPKAGEKVKGKTKDFIVVDHEGKVTRHSGLVPTPRAAANEAEQREWRSRERQLGAEEKSEAEFHTAIAAELDRDHEMALRVLLLGLLTREWGHLGAGPLGPRGDKNWSRFLVAGAPRHGMERADLGKTWENIKRLSRGVLIEAIAELSIDFVESSEYDGATAEELVEIGLAADLGVAVPAHLLPKPKAEADAEVPPAAAAA